MKPSTHRCHRLVAVATSAVGLLSVPVAAGSTLYTFTDIGKPDGADSVVGVRMNIHGHVAGWSVYYGQGEPSLKGWLWTPEEGFTILPPPPGFFLGRSRAMDISDTGVIAGDGGFDIGLAWRYENGAYTVTGDVEGMPGAYLGGINDAGDLAGTAKDGTITTPDHAWLDVDGGALLSLTPNGGRATDLNNVGQVCGYVYPVLGPFEAYRWDQENGVQLLGKLGLAFSRAARMNDAGDVVGVATSGSGNTNWAWIYTDEQGMQLLPAPFLNASTAISINNAGHVVGISEISGPDLNWLWEGGETVTNIAALFDTAAANANVITVKDINDAGQILVQVFDNDVAEFRMYVLTPPAQPMPEDVNGDGAVDVLDLLAVLSAWGPCQGCPADVNGDGVTDIVDLLMVLGSWS